MIGEHTRFCAKPILRSDRSFPVQQSNPCLPRCASFRRPAFSSQDTERCFAAQFFHVTSPGRAPLVFASPSDGHVAMITRLQSEQSRIMLSGAGGSSAFLSCSRAVCSKPQALRRLDERHHHRFCAVGVLRGSLKKDRLQGLRGVTPTKSDDPDREV
jgi:hypothetical protein